MCGPRWCVAASLALFAGCGRIDFDALGRVEDGPPGTSDGTSNGAAWTLVQVNGTVGATTPIAELGAGHLIVVAVQGDANATITIDDNGPVGNDYVAIPQAQAANAAQSSGVGLWYAAVSQPGARNVTATSTGAVYGISLWEVANLEALDVAGETSNIAATTTPTSPTLATKKPGDFVIAVVVVSNAVTSIHAGSVFTNDLLVQNDGWSHLTAVNAPAGSYQAEWDASSGTACSVAAAFYVVP